MEQLEKIKKRTYLTNKDKTEKKMIPKKYHVFSPKEIKAQLEDFKTVYLTMKERFNLDFKLFLDKLKKEEKYAYELIKDAAPKIAYFVKVKHGSNRFELKMSNNISVKITEELYLNFCNKEDKVSNI
jgi:hypothetical protein